MRLARNFLIVAVLAAVLWLGTASVSKAQGSSLGRLAFVQNGDICIKELPDGMARQLTTDGHNKIPRISPSGEWIAFQKEYMEGVEDTAWVIDSSGKESWEITGCKLEWATITDALPCFGEDGTVGVRRPPKFVLEKFSREKGFSSDTHFYGVGWIEQGPEFVYASSTWTRGFAEDYQGESILWIANTAAQTQTQLFELASVKDESVLADDSMLFTAAPSSQQFLYWVFPLFGSGSFSADGLPLYWRALNEGASHRKISDGMLQKDDWIALAPNGQQIAFISGTYRATWTNKHLEVVDLNTGARKTLTDTTVAASSPVWSPDGKQIAYVAMSDEGRIPHEEARAALQKRRIWVTDADGSNAHAITHDEQYRDEYPRWSKDGQWILFARYWQTDTDDYSQDQATLWLMRADGSEPRQVLELYGAEDSSNSEMSWFGDYGHIAWYDYFDWWQPTNTSVLPSTGVGEKSLLPIIVFGSVLLLLGGIVLLRGRINAEL